MAQERLFAQDLYLYLQELAALLSRNDQDEAGQRVLHASAFASGSTSELYGEARLLLPEILRLHESWLSEAAATRLRQVIDGVERELGRIGGA